MKTLELCNCEQPEACRIPKPPYVCRRLAGMVEIDVEDDGDEIFVPFEASRCWHRVSCGGAKLVKAKHDNNDSTHWRCPKCGGYYGEVVPGAPSGE